MFVTVIMPVRNEAAFIAGSLGAVIAQDYPPDQMEIIVADGMSTDGTREIVQSFRERHLNVQLLDNPRGIVSTALNMSIQKAQGEIIVRVDGHTEIAPDYVRQCVIELQRTGADNVGGRMTAIGDALLSKVAALATSSSFGVGDARFHYSNQEEWVDTVYMGAWRRDAFERFGLFEEELVRDQDDEFNYRLREYGGRILLSPRIKSKYTARSSFHSLWRQYFLYGYWKVRVMQKHPRQMRLRQFVPPLFVVALIGSSLLAMVSPLGGGLLGLVAGSYILANLIASVRTARQGGWRHLPLLPFAFATLHLSYGFGFLTGLIKFRNRWRDKHTPVIATEQKRVASAVGAEA